MELALTSAYKKHTGKTNGKAVWLDTPMIEMIHGEGTILKSIPAMYNMFIKYGIDIRKEPILVYPTLHYQNGGVEINGDGFTTKIPNLLVAGEAAGGGGIRAGRPAASLPRTCCADARRRRRDGAAGSFLRPHPLRGHAGVYVPDGLPIVLYGCRTAAPQHHSQHRERIGQCGARHPPGGGARLGTAGRSRGHGCLDVRGRVVSASLFPFASQQQPAPFCATGGA